MRKSDVRRTLFLMCVVLTSACSKKDLADATASAGGEKAGDNAANNTTADGVVSGGQRIEGVVFGLIANTTVMLTNGPDTVVASNGIFQFPTWVAVGGSYNVVVQAQPNGQACAVTLGAGNVGSGPVTQVEVACTPANFVVGGTVSGLAPQTFVTMVSNNVVVSTGQNGPFTLPSGYMAGDAYSVTVWNQPLGQFCTVQNGAGMVTNGNITLPHVVCTAQKAPPLRFSSDQAALVEIGQPNFQSNSSTLLRTGGTLQNNCRYNVDQCSRKSFALPGGPLYAPDYWNFRVLMFNAVPAANFASADYVLGVFDQSGINTTDFIDQGEMGQGNNGAYPEGIGGTVDMLAISNDQSFQTIFSGPLAYPQPFNFAPNGPMVTTGYNQGKCQPDYTNNISDVRFGPNIMMVADARNNRILLWQPIPTNPAASRALATGVIGQSDLGTCATPVDAAHFANVDGFYTDANYLIVADSANNRVLIWNHAAWDLTPLQPADVVLGAPDFVTPGTGAATATSFAPSSVDSDGQTLVVADLYNNRVLVWNSIPTQSNQPFDTVLGQPDATHGTCNQTTGAANGVGLPPTASATAATLCHPTGVEIAGDFLVVNDSDNNRLTIYRGRY